MATFQNVYEEYAQPVYRFLLSLTGNDDFGDGGESPDYCIVMKNLISCCITANTMSGGYLKSAFADLSEHTGENIISGNAGC